MKFSDDDHRNIHAKMCRNMHILLHGDDLDHLECIYFVNYEMTIKWGRRWELLVAEK